MSLWLCRVASISVDAGPRQSAGRREMTYVTKHIYVCWGDLIKLFHRGDCFLLIYFVVGFAMLVGVKCNIGHKVFFHSDINQSMDRVT